MEPTRCGWCLQNERLTRYHDEEWGVPVFDDRKQFEFLMLEVLQCGLNWNMMLQKREIFRDCFEDFDFKRIAAYGEAEIQRIYETPGMLRSRRKIEAVIRNARAFLTVREAYGSFSSYLWSYTNGKPVAYRGHETGKLPVSNRLSAAISQDLKRRGFSFLGPVTVYSHLQACGMVNDHQQTCACYERLLRDFPPVFLDPDGDVY